MRKFLVMILGSLFLFTGCLQQKKPEANTPLDIENALSIYNKKFNATSSKSPGTVEIVVDGKKITLGDLNGEMQRLIAASRNQLSMEQIKRLAAENLIDQTLLKNELERQGIEVPPEKISITLSNMTQFSQEGPINKNLDENEEMKQRLNKAIEFRLKLAILLAPHLKEIPAPTEEEIKSYYGNNQHKFEIPESVVVNHLTFEIDKDSTESNVEEQRKKINEAHKQLLDGADFSSITTQYYERAFTEKEITKTILRGNNPPEIENVLFTLQTNELSAPVKSQYGFHIFKLRQHHPSRKITLEEVRPKINNFLNAQRQNEMVKKYIKDLRLKADIKFVNADEKS